ncbi:MAG TPA: PspC domain-containing protein [Acidimicrobiales bacterium]|jgi:phage shock protein PspC (stress-responsive transcriptional regulator)|nr:PspC domain-containing protein [Acidimicrobiales bacterium]
MTTAASHSATPDPTSADPAGTEPEGTDPRRHQWASVPSHHLFRNREGGMVAGVAAGMAEYFDLDPNLVRVGFVALAFLGGVALPLYLAAWLLIPEKGAPCSVGEGLLARQPAR